MSEHSENLKKGQSTVTPFTNPDYRRWYAANTSLDVSSSLFVASTFLVLHVTGSPNVTGLLMGVLGAAGLFAGVIGGGLADQVSRRGILVRGATIAIVMNLVIVAILVLNQSFDLSPLSVIVVVVTALFVERIVVSAAGPAVDGALKSIIQKDQYPRAMSASQVREAILSVAGNPLAGGLFSLGNAVPFAVKTVCQSVFLIALSRVSSSLGPQPDGSERSGRPIAADDDASRIGVVRRSCSAVGNAVLSYRAAFGFFRSEPALLRFALVAPLVNFAVGVFSVWTILHLQSTGHSPAVTGAAAAGFAVGSLGGGLIAPILAERVQPGILSIAGLSMTTLMLIGFAVFGQSPVLIFVFGALAMVPTGPLNAAIFSYVFVRADNAMQGRIVATFQTLGGIAGVVSPVVAGFAVSVHQSLAVLLASSAISALGVLILASSRSVRRAQR